VRVCVYWGEGDTDLSDLSTPDMSSRLTVKVVQSEKEASGNWPAVFYKSVQVSYVGRCK